MGTENRETELVNALNAALHAMRSYQHGNADPTLANEVEAHSRAVIATPSTMSESTLTVESALAELQEMFPDESYGSIEATFFDEVGMRVRIGLRDTNFHVNGTSLEDAMRKVRQWHEGNKS